MAQAPGDVRRRYDFDPAIKSRGRVVLVVDDSPMMRHSVSEQVRRLDHDPVEVGSGEEVVPTAEFYEPRLIVLDIQMPGISGLDVLDRLKGNANLAQTQVMMVTVESNSRQILQASTWGVKDYVIKPFEAADLRARMEKLLQ